jgi:hypothetical protein
MDKTTILGLRLAAQGLSCPARNRGEYLSLVRRLQPFTPVAYTMPGNPPRLVHRTSFDDAALADKLRQQRQLVKGRFWGGNIGYVLAEDLQLYATAFQKPLTRMTPVQERVRQALRYTDELSTRQLGEETGLKNKLLTPALHRLQQACLVFEDQEDSSWARPWSLMERSWPAIDLHKMAAEDAIAQVLCRFLEGYVCATFEQLKNWTRLPGRTLLQALAGAEQDGLLVSENLPGAPQTWMRPEDRQPKSYPPEAGVFMLHRSDPLVLAEQCALKKQYAGHEVLQYLLVDGEFHGAVCGHWRIGPHDVDDVIVDLPAPQCDARKKAILTAVAQFYHPPEHHILRYTGENI